MLHSCILCFYSLVSIYCYLITYWIRGEIGELLTLFNFYGWGSFIAITAFIVCKVSKGTHIHRDNWRSHIPKECRPNRTASCAAYLVMITFTNLQPAENMTLTKLEHVVFQVNQGTVNFHKQGYSLHLLPALVNLKNHISEKTGTLANVKKGAILSVSRFAPCVSGEYQLLIRGDRA